MDNNYDIYIQRGIRKINYSGSNKDKVEYVNEFIIDENDNIKFCIDSRGIDSFFYVIEVFAGYRLIECNKYNGINRYISKDELNRGYIKLDDFIKEGKFIGREFRRIEPVITYYGTGTNKCRIIDNRYLDLNQYGYKDVKYIVLYEKDNVFLAKFIYFDKEYYGIVDCRYIQDRMYKFIGNVYDEYRDRERVYLEIVEQINKDYNINNNVKRKKL